MTRLSSTLGIALAALFALPAAAQQPPADYPSQPVTLVVPFPAGGITDNIARLVAQELGTAWGKPVVVDNRVGASGTIGAAAVARAPKDGHTALFTITTHVQMPALQRKLSYDAVKDFAAVSQIGISTSALVVTPDVPAKTLAELVTLLKAEPGKYSYGSTGVATTSHIYGELFKKEAGVDMPHVPYKGAAPMVTDLLGGHIRVAVLDTGTALPYLQSGKLRALAALGTQRSATLPQVPTFQQAGYAGFEPYAWIALFLPAGTPKPRVDKMSKAVAAIIAKPEVQKKMRDMNIEPVGSTAAEFAVVLRQDADTWKRVIDKTGIRLED
ncbi:Bug family tripartite tricarboxylate transporter substrate binding protein [Variovorax boronicumulans]|uniref:Bug family tripartite tricarboxylate transporter substrate binding protein n=1 Tax=Variovorax boronicumulans TaxID=436515 RepID=UPI0012E667C7|nr:tripartite tricarboxylate transporter substrate binding protein [Variovorax boronicumulans]GER14452.1 tripartite tricarboxylate transporter substrate binding protein [Variovorax boronicumulans]